MTSAAAAASARGAAVPTIVAIGGGELGQHETLPIDREIVRLTGLASPRALFIPTASGDAEGYRASFEAVYGGELGCRVDALCVARERMPYEEIERRILGADLIYVGGGNTLAMMRRWRLLGIDRALRLAWERGIVLAGLSAGANCWFRHATSDAPRFADPNDLTLLRVRGLGFLAATGSPHHLTEPHRRQGLIDVMRRTPGTGLAIDDWAALEVRADRYRVLRARQDAGIHKVRFDRGRLLHEPIPDEGDLSEIMP